MKLTVGFQGWLDIMKRDWEVIYDMKLYPRDLNMRSDGVSPSSWVELMR
jgi:hypothetical protein